MRELAGDDAQDLLSEAVIVNLETTREAEKRWHQESFTKVNVTYSITTSVRICNRMVQY